MKSVLHLAGASSSRSSEFSAPPLSVVLRARVSAALARISSSIRSFVRSHVTIETGTFFCSDCKAVYDGRHECPRQLEAFCMDCRAFRDVDRYATCICGSRSVMGLRAKKPSTGGLIAEFERDRTRGVA